MWDDKVTKGPVTIPYGGCYYIDEGTSAASSSITAAPNPTGGLLRTNVDTLQSTSFDWPDALLRKITTDGIRLKGDSNTSCKACKPKREHYKPKFTL